MVNYIVDDLDALLDRLKQEGVKIDAKRMNECEHTPQNGDWLEFRRLGETSLPVPGLPLVQCGAKTAFSAMRTLPRISPLLQICDALR